MKLTRDLTCMYFIWFIHKGFVTCLLTSHFPVRQIQILLKNSNPSNPHEMHMNYGVRNRTSERQMLQCVSLQNSLHCLFCSWSLVEEKGDQSPGLITQPFHLQMASEHSPSRLCPRHFLWRNHGNVPLTPAFCHFRWQGEGALSLGNQPNK